MDASKHIELTGRGPQHWLSQTDAFKMFTNKDNHFRLFPHGRIVHALDIYRTGITENVPSILQHSDGITGTPVDVMNPRGSHLYQSVALRRVFPMHLGKVPRLRIDMDYFGYDVLDCIAHARLHISKMADFIASGTEALHPIQFVEWYSGFKLTVSRMLFH